MRIRSVPVNRYVVFFSIAIIGCLVDLATKSWAFRTFGTRNGEPWWLIKNVLGFQTSLNEGALFGLGQGNTFVFALLSVAAAIGILGWLFLAGAARQWILTVALGCIAAGISGNLYDRLGFPGLVWKHAVHGHAIGDPVYAVRDWILVILVRWPWPNFNVADSLLVCGAGLLLWHAFRGQPSASSPQAVG
jgi:signal peptidase II